MRRKHHGVQVCALREQVAPRDTGRSRVLIDEKRDIGPDDLHGMMQDVAGEHRAGTAPLGIDHDTSR